MSGGHSHEKASIGRRRAGRAWRRCVSGGSCSQGAVCATAGAVELDRLLCRYQRRLQHRCRRLHPVDRDWSAAGDHDRLSSNTINPKGGLFGGQVGFNYQTGPVVWGVEGDWQWANQNNTACGLLCFNEAFPPPGAFTTTLGTTVYQKVKSFATVRGRVGWASDGRLGSRRRDRHDCDRSAGYRGSRELQQHRERRCLRCWHRSAVVGGLDRQGRVPAPRPRRHDQHLPTSGDLDGRGSPRPPAAFATTSSASA